MQGSLHQRKLPFVFLALFFLTNQLWAQIDTDVSEKTKALYDNLKKIQNSDNFMFGQEFFNSFRFSSGSAHGDEAFSDAFQITGAHPAVLGSDFHYYIEKNATERGYHTDAVKWAYQQGYVITFDWHISARNTTSYECGTAPANLAKNIANGNINGDRDWYLGELDKVISIINEDLIVDGENIPIVFRPLHEMNGGWFWWGACSGLTADEYKALYQLTVTYVKDRTNSVLFCWSPNSPFNLDRYPGDEYVDIVGVDAYEVNTTSLRTELGKVVDYAQAHDKVAVFSETGDRNSDATAGLYWKDIILPGIMDDPSGKSKKIAWVLTWINASWSEPYVPHSGSSATVKQSFIDFKNSPNVLFGDEIDDLYTYVAPVLVQSIVVKGEGDATSIDDESGTLQMIADILPTDASNKSVTWSVSDGEIATISESGLLTAVSDGAVTVRATADDGSAIFGETEITVTNQLITDVEDKKGNRFGIYPNPFISNLHISNARDIRQLQMFDATGKSLMKVTNDQEEMIIPMKELPSGIYILMIRSKDQASYVKRLVKF